MALSATHAKRDAIVLQNSRGGFASAPNSPRIFLQPASRNDGRCAEQADQTVAIAYLPNPNGVTEDEIVNRVCSMFPTAREYDVRELLFK